LRRNNTYSHTFHIFLNTLENINNILNYCKVTIKVDTKTHRNKIFKKKLKKCILGLCKQKIKISGNFTQYKNTNNLSTNFFWQSAIFRDLKDNVKKLCEKLSRTLF